MGTMMILALEAILVRLPTQRAEAPYLRSEPCLHNYIHSDYVFHIDFWR